jgi:ATP-dependent DNA helicase RecQ
MSWDGTLDEALEHFFGFRGFRDGQREVTEAVLDRDGVIAVMPTGAGKSLCYQLPAAMGSGTTLVVSPLIALMKDQVDGLTARGISATYINSQLSAWERDDRIEKTRSGVWRLLYVAPERFASERFVETLAASPIDRMAIDEAHCISQWGHDFRPDYLRIRDVATRLGLQRISAFTATATPEVRDDIVQALRLPDPKVFVHGFRRHNLTLRVLGVRSRDQKVQHILQLLRHEQGTTIVYAATRKNVERLAGLLAEQGVSATCYHAGLSEEERTSAQDAFMAGDVRVICATNAFGMGVDKSDIRFVIHHDVPGSLEAYYQEAGRAGRDGAPSECVVLFSYADVRLQEFFIDRIGEDRGNSSTPAPVPSEVQRLKALERAKLKRIVSYCYVEDCRHAALLRYFGDDERPRVPCGQCDNCLRAVRAPEPVWVSGQAGRARSSRAKEARPSDSSRSPGARALSPDEVLVVRKLLSAYARSKGRLTQSDVASLVRGIGDALPLDLQESRSFGILAGRTAKALVALSRSLQDAGALEPGPGGKARPVLTAYGVSVMKGDRPIQVAFPATTGAATPDEAAEYDTALFDRLREVRAARAAEDGVPAFIVAHDSLLRLMAASRPTSAEALLQVKGMGPAKLETYGQMWLEALRGWSGEE